MYRITVVVPVFNEEATVLPLLREVRAQSIQGIEFEIVVVDDGSKDGTLALLEKNPNLFDILIKQPNNGGKGAAVLAGLRVATGDYILFQDADLEYLPSDYGALLYPVTAFSAEIVMGSRFAAPKFTRVQYFWHKVGNRLITLLFNIAFNTTFTDIYSCYLLYKRSLINPTELTSLGWEQQAEILSRLVRRAKIIYEVPISYHGRSYEEGKKIRPYHAIFIIIMIFRRWIFG
jgi:glycosyltransferase involved in cell wall biosynthesis